MNMKLCKHRIVFVILKCFTAIVVGNRSTHLQKSKPERERERKLCIMRLNSDKR